MYEQDDNDVRLKMLADSFENLTSELGTKTFRDTVEDETSERCWETETKHIRICYKPEPGNRC